MSQDLLVSSDPHVSPQMWSRIDGELSAIAATKGVRILLAVESGSRAWRFPSPDSDYDVRFIYLRQPRDYLGVAPQRDVIERPVDAVLDVSGWDLRKALALMAGSNAVLQEWLTSPIRYRADTALVERLLALATETADPVAYCYHYDRMARRHFEVISENETPRLKTYCYALRSVFALRWLRQQNSLPPMDLPHLMAGTDIADDLRQAIARLVEHKLEAGEREIMDRHPLLDNFIGEVLTGRTERPLPGHRPFLPRVDAFFADLVLGNDRGSCA